MWESLRKRHSKEKLLRFNDELLLLILSGSLVLSVAALFADYLWWLDLLTHFRPYYALGAFGVGTFCLVTRRYKLCALAATVVCGNGLLIAPYVIPHDSATAGPVSGTSVSSASAGETFRLANFNVRTGNAQYGLVIDEILRASPDIIVLTEIDSRWAAALAPLRTNYPHAVLEPRADNFGIGLYSKRPFVEQTILPLGRARLPAISVVVPISGREVRVIGAHVVPPMSKSAFVERNQGIADLQATIVETSVPTIITGDFNITVYSPVLQRFLAATNLRDTSLGQGWGGTWPVATPWARITIDHCFYSPEFKFIKRFIGSDVGSDHFPIFADFRL